MAINDIVARLTLNAQQFRAQFDSAIDQATAKAKTGGRQIGEGFSGEANAKLNEFASRIPVVGGALSGLAGPALAAAAGVGAVTAALGFAIGEAEAYAREAGKLDAVLRATGNTTGFSAEQLRAYADELETTFAISAEEFLAAERQLSSFRGIAGSTFKDVLELSADLAATFGGDVVSSSEKLGNVLQNLATGDVDGLAKGFKFLGVETIKTIEALAKQGQTFEAQQALIDALRSRVGGAGAAGGDNLTGDFFRLKDAIGDSARALAENSGAYDAARDYVQRLAKEVGVLSGLFDGLANRPAPFSAAAFQNDLVRLGLRDAPAAASAAPFSITAGANQFPGLPNIDGARAADLLSARAAADAAKAEGDKRRAAEAVAEAAKKQVKEFEAAAKATAQMKTNLANAIGDLELQAQLAGQTREEQERANIIRRLEVQFGKVLTDQQREQIRDAISLRQIREDIVRLRKEEIDLFKQQSQQQFDVSVASARSRTESAFQNDLSKFIRKNNPFVPDAQDPETRRRFEFTSNAFFEILSRGQGSFWDSFQQFGFRTVSNIAAKLVQDSGLAAKLGGLGPVGQSLGAGFAGFSLGSSLTQNNTGAKIGGGVGGVAGFAIGGPLGSFIGSFIGSAIGGLIGKRDDFSGANLSIAGGQATAGGFVSRGDGQLQIAQQLAGSFSTSLNSIAQALGGTLANGTNLGTLGTNKDAFVFNANGTSTAASAGGLRFANAEQAVEAALRNALAKGAITGIDATVQRLLSTGDLQAQLGKATALANALKGFDAATNPFAEQVRTLTDEFTQLRDIMAEAGSSTADLNKASGEYDRRLQAIKDAATQATATLRNFLSSLGFGSSSPLALGEQRSAALAEFQGLSARIGQSGFDQGAFVAAGQRLLDIEGQLFGRTDAFFQTFRQVQADTARAISAIDNATAITGDNPFARATADNTAATAENTAMLNMLPQLPAMIGQQIAAALAAAGIGGDGGGRGFVINQVKAA
ncbi:MAG: hypothetical protein B7Y35_06115 [Sphingomonadales bacterium 28-64-96]|nr:MAG: hypothetical protein B7Y35_06115 [Sphingomonadales bacterium 28-64-96]